MAQLSPPKPPTSKEPHLHCLQNLREYHLPCHPTPSTFIPTLAKALDLLLQGLNKRLLQTYLWE